MSTQEAQHSEYSQHISPIDEIISDARNGKMFILIDDEDRENEGDLIIPAQMADAEAVNFMATHGRGLICLAMQGERIDALGLPMMAARNSSRHETAFTVSIEAREGVTTGISAADRAQTIAVAISTQSGPADLATPGHVFPLRAREGGVLMRAGHTEAAVDLSRLAGLYPAGVICEIMKPDGTMARLPDLVTFAQEHGLKIGTISDLIAYRRRYDNLVIGSAAEEVASAHGGVWQKRDFTDTITRRRHRALVMGDLTTSGPVLVRMHVADVMQDMLAIGPKRDQLRHAMQDIAKEGRGVIVILSGDDQPDEGGTDGIIRQYGVGAQILCQLGVHEMILLSNSAKLTPIGLEGYGLSIQSIRPITGTDTPDNAL